MKNIQFLSPVELHRNGLGRRYEAYETYFILIVNLLAYKSLRNVALHGITMRAKVKNTETNKPIHCYA